MYRVVRFYFSHPSGIRRRIVRRRILTEEEAQRFCRDPETSSSTATGRAARRLTARVDPWFCGYEKGR